MVTCYLFTPSHIYHDSHFNKENKNIFTLSLKNNERWSKQKYVSQYESTDSYTCKYTRFCKAVEIVFTAETSLNQRRYSQVPLPKHESNFTSLPTIADISLVKSSCKVQSSCLYNQPRPGTQSYRFGPLTGEESQIW